MYKNKIVAVPSEIGAATNLRIISLANNKIGTLPNGLGLLQNLEEFYVGGNGTLRTLPGTVHGWKKIRAIYCQSCPKMKSLPYEIELCTTLKDLDLNSGKKKQTCQYPKDLKDKIPRLRIRGGKPKKGKKGKSLMPKTPTPLGAPLVSPASKQ